MESRDIQYACGIYMFRNKVNNKVYIGRSNNLKHRYWEHMRLLRAGIEPCKKLNRAWQKYGEDSFIFDIVCYCLENELNALESYFINEYDSLRNGYNCTAGGDGIVGYKHTDEAKEKIRKSSTGRKHTEESIQKMREVQKGRTFSDETIKKMQDAWTTERRQRMSEHRSGKNHPMYGRRGIKSHSSVAVIADTGEVFASMTEAAHWCGVASGCTLSNNVRGATSHCGRHPDTGRPLTWRLATEEEKKKLIA